MKKRMGLILLAAALALSSGCAAMLERSYVSATTHVDYDSEEEDPSILRAETYQSLVNSILYFVESHAATGTIRLYNYTGDVEADLANACTEILNEDPLGAYAVRDIRYDTTRIVTYYEVNLSLIYSRSSQEVEAIRSVSGLSELRQAFSDLVSDGGTHAAFRFSYFSWTELQRPAPRCPGCSGGVFALPRQRIPAHCGAYGHLAPQRMGSVPAGGPAGPEHGRAAGGAPPGGRQLYPGGADPDSSRPWGLR